MTTSTILNKYMLQYNSMQSYAKLRDLLYNGQINHNDSLEVVPKATIPRVVKPKKPVTKQQSIIQNYDDNVILAINNDQHFGDIIKAFRKQKSPLVNIYYNENSSSIVCFIKNMVGFPLLITTIPNDILKQNIYANRAYITPGMCYTFPLNDNIFKDISQNKSYIYSMIFSKTTDGIKFTYNATIGNNKPVTFETTQIEQKDIKTIINVSFCLDVEALAIHMNDDNFDALDTLNWMNIMIISKQQEQDKFNSSCSSTSHNKIVIKDNKLTYIKQDTLINQIVELCNERDSLRWKLNFTDIAPNDDGEYVFELYNFDVMFKSVYNKNISMNDNIYYIFGQYLDNTYILGKVITSTNIDTSHGFNLQALFKGGYSTKEIYMCRSLNTFKIATVTDQ